MAYIPTQKSDFDSRLAGILPDYSHAPPDARIIELLRTNTPPSPFERIGLETTLSKAPDRIAELDCLIHATTSLLDYLTKDRNQAVANQADAKKILSPARRIPPEVLTRIFICCGKLSDRRGPPLNPHAVPWTLTHVCRKWREVAIATPNIWSTICLNFMQDKFLRGSRVHKAAFMLGVILDRARPHDLDVIIQHDDDISTHPACAVLLPSVRYWKSLEIVGVACNPRFLLPCCCFFERLETVTVEQPLAGGTETMDIFAVAPRLRSFTNSSDAPFFLPANLVEFRDTFPFSEDTRATLHSLVNIETLSISCSSYSSELPRIHLPKLSELELTMNLGCFSAAFITYNHFDLPSLTHLKILFVPSQPMFPPHIPQPIHSSTVTSLTLTWLTLSQKLSTLDIEQEFSSCCRLPNLRCLTVEDFSDINPIMGALSVCPGRNVLFPQISKLDIKGGSDLCNLYKDPFDMHILVDLVQSRRVHGALREFELVWEQELVNDDDDTRSQWQQLNTLQGGIQISASIKCL